MESSTSRLHPLLTAAAISVTVFSAVGVGALTGLVPQSIGSAKEVTAPAIEAPKPVVKPLPPVAKSRPAARPSTPKPVVKPGSLGTIEAVREVQQAGEHTALGPIAGGVAGAVIGSQFGRGNGKKVMTVLGAAGGAFAGREIEKQARGSKRWEIEVRHDSGTQETVLSDVAPTFVAGDRVRVVDGRLQPV